MITLVSSDQHPNPQAKVSPSASNFQEASLKAISPIFDGDNGPEFPPHYMNAAFISLESNQTLKVATEGVEDFILSPSTANLPPRNPSLNNNLKGTIFKFSKCMD